MVPLYWGETAIEIPQQYHEIVKAGRGHRKIQDKNLIEDVVFWLESMEDSRYIDEPFKFHGNFERYNGK